jgi:hypothetical protein
MLINKSNSYTPGDVVTFRLVTGEEILGRLVEDQADCFIIERPMSLVPSGQGLAMMPLAMTIELNNKIQLQKNHVIVHGATRKEAVDGYTEATTNIKVVRGGSLV